MMTSCRVARMLAVCVIAGAAALYATLVRADDCKGIACSELKISNGQIRNSGIHVIHVVVWAKVGGFACKIFDQYVLLPSSAVKKLPDGFCVVEASITTK